MSRGAAGARPSPLPPACLLVATLFLFIPSTLYLGNAPEFDVPLPGILAVYLPVAGLSLAALVVHVILDAFQSDVFGEIVEEDGLGADLEGFVWFRNNLGGFPSTLMSIPYILSGRAYANERPPADFLFDALDRSAFYNRLSDLGYEVHLLPSWRVHRCVGRFSSCYSIPEPYDAPRRAMVGNGLVLFDLTLFRAAPTPLKPYVHRDERWLTRSLLTSGRPPGRFFNQLEFMRDYAARIEVTDGPPTYHLLHLWPPHYPVVSDGQCRYVGPRTGTREEYKEQARCALSMLGGLLDALRARAIYDRSLIVVQSDHGAGHPVAIRNLPPASAPRGDGVDPGVLSNQLAGLAFALLAVKLPGATGPLSISDAPTTAADVGPTVLRVAGGDGDLDPSVFDREPGAPRRRVFRFYRWLHDRWKTPSIGPMQEYVVSGDVHDFDGWRLGRTILPASDYEPVPEIDAGTGDGAHQLLGGWGTNEKLGDGTTVAWAFGGSATLVLPIPESERAKLTARLLTFPPEGEVQHIEVRLDRTTIGHWEVPNTGWSFVDYELLLPDTARRRRVGIVEFTFSHCRAPRDDERDQRPLAALFDWIRIEPAS